jgi:hypothetical protein
MIRQYRSRRGGPAVGGDYPTASVPSTASHPARSAARSGPVCGQRQLTTTTFAADENTNVALPSVGVGADLMPVTLQLTAGRPPTSYATAGPIMRAIGELCNSRSTRQEVAKRRKIGNVRATRGLRDGDSVARRSAG